MVVTEGEALLDLKDRLVSPTARFHTLGAQAGDLVDLIGPSGQHAAGRILRVVSETTLVIEGQPEMGFGALFGGDPREDGVGDEIVVQCTVVRLVAEPCRHCEEQGVPAESDHRHCLSCRERIPLARDTRYANCDVCIRGMRARLVAGNAIDQEYAMFNGKLKVKVHARTAEEGDFVQEWQDHFQRELGGRTTAYFLDEVAKACLAVVLDDDGNGNRPMAVVEDPDLDAKIAVALAMKFFKDQRESRYKLTLSCMSRLDKLVEEACFYRIVEKDTKQQVEALAEQLCTSTGPVTGEVELWDGMERVTFWDPTKELSDEADGYAETMIAAYLASSRGVLHMSDARKTFTKTVCRLACRFVGDSKVSYQPTGDFKQRLGYLLSLPLPLYYLYMTAANVWDRRVLRAGSPEVVGNS